jgi:hypothetical protein
MPHYPPFSAWPWNLGIKMKVSADHSYAHSTDTVFSFFTAADEIEAKQKALGARKIRIVDCESDSDGALVRIVREFPAEVPGILAKFLQPWNRVEQSEHWRKCGDGRYESDLAIDIANVPVTVSGTLELKPVAGGCVNQVRLSVDCGIPFLGKPLVEFVVKDCKRLIAAEYEYVTARLGPA